MVNIVINGYRNYEKENEIVLMSKVEFALRSFPIEHLQKALHVSCGKGNDELQFGQFLRVVRDVPFISNTESPGIARIQDSDNQPLIFRLNGINYGIPEEIMTPSMDEKYPMLTVLSQHLRNFNNKTVLAKQLAPPLDITVKWYDPAVLNIENTWKEANIEYEQYDILPRLGQYHAVRDIDGCIRHLIQEMKIDGKRCLIPVTFAQHPRYRIPLVCHFPFSVEWWLMGCEYLKKYRSAEIWITNEIDNVNNCMNIAEEHIFLSYCFGVEMIPYLKLDCLYNRKVNVLIIKRTDKQEMKRNLEEAVLLFSRLKSLDVNTEFKVVDEADNLQLSVETICLGSCELPYYVFYHRVKSENIENIVEMARAYGIEIPENLRPDRYGALICYNSKELVKGFLNAGELTAITTYTGVDLALITCSFAAELQNKNIFIKKWSCSKNIKPVLFIKNNTVLRHKTIYQKLSDDKLYCFEIPCGSRDIVEGRLAHIVKENDFNVLIFESRMMVHEYRHELQFACSWAQKHGLGIIVLTTLEDSAGSAFFSDVCSKDLHIWWTKNKRFEYIVEDRPLLTGDISAFKISFEENKWIVQDHVENEICNLEDRNIQILHLSRENETINPASGLNYRRK